MEDFIRTLAIRCAEVDMQPNALFGVPSDILGTARLLFDFATGRGISNPLEGLAAQVQDCETIADLATFAGALATETADMIWLFKQLDAIRDART